LNNETIESTNGTDVALASYWATNDVKTAFQAAINAAKAVLNSDNQSAVNVAVTTLNTAIGVFKNARQQGTKSSGFTQTELTELITTANAAKNGIIISTDGSDVSPSEYWVTQSVFNTFNSAITTAQNASGNLDTAYNTLNTAITTFNNAKAHGTKQVNQYITTIGEYFEQYMGYTIPSGGITVSQIFEEIGMGYDDYLELGSNAFLYKDQACTQPFSGSDIIYANTKFYLKSDPIPVRTKIGEITGTITLTDVPNPAPQVSINVFGNSGGNWWSSFPSSRINISGSGIVSNIYWSIPVYENDSFFASNGNFSLYVSSGNSGFEISIPTTPYISTVNANVGSLGTVSIKSITLSGTINVTNNGQPVPGVYIDIEVIVQEYERRYVAYLTSPGANASWSITLQPFDSPTQVVFRVTGVYLYVVEEKRYQQLLFERELSSPTVNVYNTDVSGITLNVGDIKTITMSGTVNVTYNGQPVPEVSIEANYQGGVCGTRLTSPGANAPWSITLEALDSSKQVNFYVYCYSADGEYLFSKSVILSPPVYVYNTNVSGITLNLGNITN
jgi:hypothetical protein